MNISKRAAKRMATVGLLGFAGVLAYDIHLGLKAAAIATAPPYRAAERIYELGEETAAREEAIDDCLNAHPQEPDACLSTVTDYFEYAEQANAERAQLESFPGYQAAAEEMEQWHGQLPWFGAGFLCFFTSL